MNINNEHVILFMIRKYNFLFDVYRRHCLKPEYGGFINSSLKNRLSCKQSIDKLKNKIKKETRL